MKKEGTERAQLNPFTSPTLFWSLLSVQRQVFWLTPTLVTFPFSQWLINRLQCLQLQIQLRIYTGFLFNFAQTKTKEQCKSTDFIW